MKTKVRNGAIAASLACVALSSALALTVGSYSAFAEEAVPIQDNTLVACEQALKTVSYDVDSIVSGYNDTRKTDEWLATKIEYSSPVFLIEDNEYGMYLDFDADNGYVVITTNKKIYSLETSGDLEYLRDGNDIYYSYIDGFMFVDDNEQFQRFEKKEDLNADEYIGSPAISKGNTTLSWNISNAFRNPTSSTNSASDGSVVYPGQTSAGDGEIDPSKISSYVSARYPGFTLKTKDNTMATRFEYAYQGDTSYYSRYYTGGGTGSEGNCSLNAMYNVLRDWGKRGYINVPYSQTDDIRTSILSDRLYAAYGKGTKSGSDKYGNFVWRTNYDYNLSTMPTLYSNIRSYALNHNYSPLDGYSRSNVPATMEYVANFLYDNNIGVAHTTDVSTITSKVYSNRCSYLSISGSSTYGNHGVAVIGYHLYSKETKINNSYSIMEYKYFYEIADGWNYTSQVFDPNTSAKPSLNFYYLARC